MTSFVCQDCGTSFTLPPSVRDRYPGWVPRQCLDCRKGASTARPASSRPRTSNRRRSKGASELLTLAEVLEKYTEGPTTGVFTDGSSVPNPGPGGWGAVYVVDGEIVAQDHGHDPDTTNNRMELQALIAACDLVPDGEAVTVYSDSNLAVRTINEWAAGWRARGWKRKTGPVENLDLVKVAYERFSSRPELTLTWIRAHDGSRWNEYADALASAWQRDEL
jgi:ribonuclease HI